MFSDSCFEVNYNLLKAITDYDYSDLYKDKLIKIIMALTEIKDSLDWELEDPSTHLANNKQRSLEVAKKMYENAQAKRNDDTVDFFDDI